MCAPPLKMKLKMLCMYRGYVYAYARFFITAFPGLEHRMILRMTGTGITRVVMQRCTGVAYGNDHPHVDGMGEICLDGSVYDQSRRLARQDKYPEAMMVVAEALRHIRPSHIANYHYLPCHMCGRMMHKYDIRKCFNCENYVCQECSSLLQPTPTKIGGRLCDRCQESYYVKKEKV